jgi:hypothetical protein
MVSGALACCIPGLQGVVSFENPQPLGRPGPTSRRSQRLWARHLATVEGTSGESISAVLAKSTMTSGIATLYTPGDTVLGTEADFSSSGESLMEPKVLPTTGTYTVLMVPGAEYTGSVELTPHLFYNVTGSLSPSTSGVSETVSLSTVGQKASYAVTVTSGEEVSLKANELTFGGSVRLEWLNSYGQAVAEDGISSGGGFMESVAFPEAGTYTLVVNPFSRTGSMKLTAYNATAVTGTITPSSGGESKTVTTSVPGQKAKITFSGNSGEEISLVLSESTIASGGFTVYSPEGSAVVSGGLAGLTGPFKLGSTGTYSL